MFNNGECSQAVAAEDQRAVHPAPAAQPVWVPAAQFGQPPNRPAPQQQQQFCAAPCTSAAANHPHQPAPHWAGFQPTGAYWAAAPNAGPQAAYWAPVPQPGPSTSGAVGFPAPPPVCWAPAPHQVPYRTQHSAQHTAPHPAPAHTRSQPVLNAASRPHFQLPPLPFAASAIYAGAAIPSSPLQFARPAVTVARLLSTAPASTTSSAPKRPHPSAAADQPGPSGARPAPVKRTRKAADGAVGPAPKRRRGRQPTATLCSQPSRRPAIMDNPFLDPTQAYELYSIRNGRFLPFIMEDAIKLRPPPVFKVPVLPTRRRAQPVPTRQPLQPLRPLQQQQPEVIDLTEGGVDPALIDLTIDGEAEAQQQHHQREYGQRQQQEHQHQQQEQEQQQQHQQQQAEEANKENMAPAQEPVDPADIDLFSFGADKEDKPMEQERQPAPVPAPSSPAANPDNFAVRYVRPAFDSEDEGDDLIERVLSEDPWAHDEFSQENRHEFEFNGFN